ncbi:NTM1B methyltransferase, partial [Amia calva]|nr:NTM1B methyltransferase [Amia calva]
TANMDYMGAHLAFRSRWKETDDDLCRHSMSFVLHKAIRHDFFESYLYLLEKLPLVKLYAVTSEVIDGEKQFYARAQNFYKDVPASVEGMMGDYVELSDVDIEGSREFLKKFVGGAGKAGTVCALDCGCGIGRVTKNVLLPVFETVEMADMMEDFLVYAHECYLGKDADRIETYYCYSLQDLTPPVKKYDVIWIQWVAYFTSRSTKIDPRAGYYFIKLWHIYMFDYLTAYTYTYHMVLLCVITLEGCRLDPVDSSLIRHIDIVKRIIYKSDLEIIYIQKQEGFPEQIVPVWMIAIK